MAQVTVLEDTSATPGGDRVPTGHLAGVKSEKGHRHWRATDGFIFTDHESVTTSPDSGHGDAAGWPYDLSR